MTAQRSSDHVKVVVEPTSQGCFGVYVNAQHAYRYCGDDLASAVAAICQVADCGVAGIELIIWNRLDIERFDQLVERILTNGWHMLAEHDDHVRLRRTAAAA